MSFEEFQTAATSADSPPPDVTPALRALWYDRRGDWEAAHAAAQADSGLDAAWVHAYLHRKEGDNGNAGYWYRRAGQPLRAGTADLDDEWCEIARALVSA